MIHRKAEKNQFIIGILKISHFCTLQNRKNVNQYLRFVHTNKIVSVFKLIYREQNNSNIKHYSQDVQYLII